MKTSLLILTAGTLLSALPLSAEAQVLRRHDPFARGGQPDRQYGYPYGAYNQFGYNQLERGGVYPYTLPQRGRFRQHLDSGVYRPWQYPYGYEESYNEDQYPYSYDYGYDDGYIPPYWEDYGWRDGWSAYPYSAYPYGSDYDPGWGYDQSWGSDGGNQNYNYGYDYDE